MVKDDSMKTALNAGWGEADITPDGHVVELDGQYYQRVSRGIHSRLKAVALVLERQDERVVMVSLDLVGVPEDYMARLRESMAARIPALSGATLMVNAIHTHNAPGLRPFRKWWAPHPGTLPTEDFQDLVEQRVLDAVEAAWTGRRPAGIANALDFARVGHCRRAVYADGTAEMYGDTGRDDFMGMEGGEDSGVDLLFFFNAQGVPTGVVVNVACPSQIMEATYEVSSDFMGALREKLKTEYGADFMMLSQISASGCQSPRDLSRGYRGEPDFWHADGVDVMSDRLRDAVRRAYPRARDTIVYGAGLSRESRTLALPRRRASYEEYVAAKADIARRVAKQDVETAYADFCREVHANERIAGRPGPYDDKRHHFVEIQNAEAVVRRYEEQNASPERDVELHIVRIGDVVFATNPFELYLEFGQRIKARSPARQTCLIQLANGIGGYLPSRRAEALGGYGGLIINGEVGADGGSRLVDETVGGIRRLFGDRSPSSR